MEKLYTINFCISLIFVILYAYQYLYILIGSLKKPVRFENSRENRYAVLISARNEERVIEHLINSIKAQDYPAELIDIYVVADNCTDSTADVAAAAGAFVERRRNTEYIGKGYALNFLFGRIFDRHGQDYYDGFFVFDADNLLEPNYISEMNKVFSAGYKVVTSYRNSKNYGGNWISAGYALWFIREAVHLNNARMQLGTSCAVSGTGFLFHKDIAKRNDGWRFYLLTEDIEFTVDCILHGDKIGYCHDAVFYDEQPQSFIQSWKQRMRWTRGYLQVFCKYGFKLFCGIFRKGGFAFFDMTVTIMPAIVLSTAAFTANIIFIAKAFGEHAPVLPDLLLSLTQMLGNAYLMLFIIGLFAGIKERRRILCPLPKRIAYFFTFPLFLFTYIPITIAAMFKKVKWAPIRHTVAISYEQCKNK